MTSPTMTARVVGKVLGRTTALAFVTDNTGNEVRVMWQAHRRNGHPRGFRCAIHGDTGTDDPCIHAIAAGRAFRLQRKAERRTAHTPPPGGPLRSTTENGTGGEGSEKCGQRLASTAEGGR